MVRDILGEKKKNDFRGPVNWSCTATMHLKYRSSQMIGRCSKYEAIRTAS